MTHGAHKVGGLHGASQNYRMNIGNLTQYSSNSLVQHVLCSMHVACIAQTGNLRPFN